MYRNGNNINLQEYYIFDQDQENVDEEEETANNDDLEDANVVITALFQSIEEGNVSIVEDLLRAYKIDPNLPNENGELALHIASGFGNLDIIDILIRFGSFLNLGDAHGDTPIHWAARQGNFDSIKFLYEKDAEVNAQNKSGETGIHLAARHDYVDTIRQLCKCGANVDLTDEHGETAMHIAVWHGFPRIVHVLGEVGAKVDIQNKDEEAALHCAAARGHIDCVRCLLSIGVNMNILDKNGCTALHLALRRHHTEIAILLIKNKINVNVCDINGENALHLSCLSGQRSAVNELCLAGCNLNCQNSLGDTPLHLAVRAGHLEIVRRLCAAGANILIKNFSGLLPENVHHKSSELRNKCLMKNYEDINKLLSQVKDVSTKCKLIGMLKPTAIYYGKEIHGKIVNNLTICSICSAFSETSNLSKSSLSTCCNSSGECCLKSNFVEEFCCNSNVGVGQSIEKLVSNEKLVSAGNNLPSNLQRFNVKIFGHCSTGKTTLIETLGCSYLASWFRKSPKTVLSSPISISSTSLCSSTFNTFHKNHNQNLTQAANSCNSFASNKRPNSLSIGSSKSSLNSNFAITPPQTPNNGEPVSNCCLISSDSSNLSSSSFNCNNSWCKNSMNCAISEDLLFSNEADDLNFCNLIELKQSQILNAKHKTECTKGINIQQINVPNVGELNLWEFSGQKNYFQVYDKFLNQCTSLNLILFRACDTFEQQLLQACYWLDFIKARIKLKPPFLYGGQLKNLNKILLIATHADSVHNFQTTVNMQNMSETTVQWLDELKLKLSNDLIENLEILLKLLKTKYGFYFDLNDKIYLVDSHVVNSNTVKQIKQQMVSFKSLFFQKLGPISNFLENVIRELNNLRKLYPNSPMMSYIQFVELIREQINILAEDEHIELICKQLQELGEIVRLKNEHLEAQDLIVYNIKWLSSDVIGKLLNPEYSDNNGKISGHYSVDDLQNLFPTIDALDLVLVLENIELCTSCETEGNFLYLFPCFIKIGRPEHMWESNGFNNSANEERSSQNDEKLRFTYIGLRLQCEDNFSSCHLLTCLFCRLQILFERCIQQNTIMQNDFAKLKLIHWMNGMKLSYENLETVITLGRCTPALYFDSIQIKTRGFQSESDDCFRLFEFTVTLVEQCLTSICPGLLIERHYFSPTEMKTNKKIFHMYSPMDLFLAICPIEGFKQSKIVECENKSNKLRMKINNPTGNFEEEVCNVISCGIDDIKVLKNESNNFLVNIIKNFLQYFIQIKYNNYMDNRSITDLKEKEIFNPIFIIDQHLCNLPLLTKHRLCILLDPPEAMGQDWCMLSVKLNLTEKLPILDIGKSKTISPTWRLIEECSNEPNYHIKLLLTKLVELNRKDALTIILKTTPLIKFISINNDFFSMSDMSKSLYSDYNFCSSGSNISR